MTMGKYDLTTLDEEFSRILTHFQEHHQNQRDNVSFYNHSAFYAKTKNKIGVNLLKAFADKNINYTSLYPTTKVPSADTTPDGIALASQNEKIIYGAHESNGLKVLQKKWAADGTLMMEAFAETTFDLTKRAVKIKRLDPRFCYYKFANQNDDTISVFWYAYPMTIKQVKEEFGIDVKKGNVNADGYDAAGNPVLADQEDRTWVIKRWDDKTMCMWAGDQFIVKPHKHLCPRFPIDRCVPFNDFDATRFPQSFFAPLVPLQAEYNDTLRKKLLVLTRLATIPVVVKGVSVAQQAAVKEALMTGGFIGLKPTGDASFLQLQETKLFDEHLDRIFQNMKDISGYSTVTFGEIAGANTSGDAVAMYYQPTTQAAQNQWISWARFYESINEKILAFYEAFGKTNESFKLYGSMPHSTWDVLEEDGGKSLVRNRLGNFTVEFNGKQIGGYYRNQVITPSVTPKDENATKRLILDAVSNGLISRITAYEEWGFTDPKEQLDLLEQEQSNPSLNPDGMSKLLTAQNSMMGQGPMDGMNPEDMAMMGEGGMNAAMAQR
jgi:hypothetical protein